MTDLPTGMVTFLFTDIEGSTRLWEQDSGAMQRLLRSHDALVRAAIETHHGRVFKTMGDGFCAAFANPLEAAQCCVSVQQALPCELPGLQVRMALYTGEAEVREGDYFGSTLNRVARLLTAGHGGQILLSEVTAERVRHVLPTDIDLRPLGVHRLRDLATPETIYQLVGVGLPSRFPPLNSLDIAFRKGVRRASVIAAGILSVVAGLAATALHQANRAEAGQRTLRQHLYVARIGLAQQAWDAGNVGRAEELLNAIRPQGRQEDLRGFEWGYFWRLCQDDADFTLQGANQRIAAVAFSANGKTLMTRDDNAMVRLWDLGMKRQSASFKPERSVVSEAFSPDGRTLATGSGDGTIRLWNLVTHSEVGSLQDHQRPVHLTFSPDGQTLVSCGDRKVKLWNVANWRIAATLQKPQGRVDYAVFSEDGKTLAVSASEGATVWDVVTRRKIASLGSHTMALTPDGKTLAIAVLNNTVELWDVAFQQKLATLKGHRDIIWGLTFSPDGKSLASGSIDRTIKLWNVATRQEVATLRGHRSAVTSVAFSPDGKSLASGSEDRTVKLWDLTPNRDSVVLRGHAAGVTAVALSADGKLLASGSDDSTVRLWNVATGREVALLRGHKQSVHAVSFSPDGRWLATGSTDQTTKLWSVVSMRDVATLPAASTRHQSVAFSPDGRLLAVIGEGTAWLWDVARRRQAAEIKGVPAATKPIAFSPDGRNLATGTLGRPVVKIWDVVTRREVSSFRGSSTSSRAQSLAFSPDGKSLAIGWLNYTVSLWNIASRQETLLPGHARYVDSVAFSPDGKTLAVSGPGNTIQLWNLTTLEGVATLPGHEGAIWSIAFSQDGSIMATGSLDRTIRLWRATPPAEADAQAQVPRAVNDSPVPGKGP